MIAMQKPSVTYKREALRCCSLSKNGPAPFLHKMLQNTSVPSVKKLKVRVSLLQTLKALRNLQSKALATR